MNLDRKSFLVSATMPLLTQVRVHAADNRMNVLFMLAGDLNTPLGCYGNRNT